MSKESLRISLAHVGMALRDPEEFALAWDREENYRTPVWCALGLTAIAGTTIYGTTMGIGGGAASMLTKGALMTLGAGLAWAIPLPALYVLNSFAGSRLKASTTLLAALVTTSWGGLALIASVPINWFFSAAIPAQSPELYSANTARWIVLGVNLVVHAGVTISMFDVFRRVMQALEPDSETNPLWFLGLVIVIGCQLFYLFNLFTW